MLTSVSEKSWSSRSGFGWISGSVGVGWNNKIALNLDAPEAGAERKFLFNKQSQRRGPGTSKFELSSPINCDSIHYNDCHEDGRT